MAASPKRKGSEAANGSPKKPRLSNTNDINDDNTNDLAEEIPFLPSSTTAAGAPDSHINHAAAIAYWSSTEASVSGVLGGYPQVSRIDLQGSSNFFAKLRRQHSKDPSETKKKLRRAADCGAGIGRITAGFLSHVAEVVDIVEPVQSFTDAIKGHASVGEVYNVGLESWRPADEDARVRRRGEGYDLIWNQWCLGQLTDAQVVAYLRRLQLPGALSAGGWIVVKENLSNHYLGEDVYDEVDSSVTRTDGKFRGLFEEAGLRLVSTELQKGFPKGLYAVRAYALQPR